jgi:hypothetical protein
MYLGTMEEDSAGRHIEPVPYPRRYRHCTHGPVRDWRHRDQCDDTTG